MICHDVVLYVVASKGIKFVALAGRLLLPWCFQVPGFQEDFGGGYIGVKGFRV